MRTLPVLCQKESDLWMCVLFERPPCGGNFHSLSNGLVDNVLSSSGHSMHVLIDIQVNALA